MENAKIFYLVIIIEQRQCFANNNLGNLSWVAYDLGIKGTSFSIQLLVALHTFCFKCNSLTKPDMANKFIIGGSEAPLSDFTISQIRALKIYSNKKGNYPSLLELNKKRTHLS